MLSLLSGRTSSKSVAQHDLPLSDGVSVSPVVPVWGLWQQIRTGFRTFAEYILRCTVTELLFKSRTEEWAHRIDVQ